MLQKRNSNAGFPAIGLPFSEESHGVITADGETGVPINHDPLRRGGAGVGQTGKERKHQSAERCTMNAVSLSLSPCCGSNSHRADAAGRD
jgi:hypothetical protein